MALFRVAFFTSLAIHFFPALLWLDDAYAPGALRSMEWNGWLFVHFTDFPRPLVRAASVVTMLACTAGIVGFRPRIAAIVSGIGLYAFASFNGFPVQTLAIVDTWALLLLWSICGGGSAVWSVDAWLARRSGKTMPPEPKLFASLALYQTMLAVFFAGIEKVLAGWPGTNEMGVLLSYPKGFFVRDWVWSSNWLHGAGITTALTWATLVVEIGMPTLLVYKKTRLAALALYEAFFLGIIAMLEVPPLFYGMFAFGGLLALDDDDVASIEARLRKVFGYARRSEAA